MAEDPRLFPVKQYPHTFSPRQIVKGDFDKDGELDLLVVQFDSAHLRLYRGLPGGEFELPLSPYAQLDVSHLRVADLDHDQVLDIVVMYKGFANFGVMIGNGDGTFEPTVLHSVGITAKDLELIDTDQDGELDVVLGHSFPGPNAQLRVHRGDGTGGFSAPSSQITGAAGERIRSGDFNGDNDPDIVMVDTPLQQVHVLLGTPGAAFAPPITLPLGVEPDDVLIDDFDGDGHADIATANGIAGTISQFLGDGLGGFSVGPTLSATGDVQQIRYTDLDLDGYEDFLCASGSFQSLEGVSWLRGLPGGGHAPYVEIDWGQGCQTVLVDDFNKDGRPDFVTGNYSSNFISLVLGNDEGTFPMAPRTYAGLSLQDLRTADVNGDGHLDALVSRRAFGGQPGELQTYFGDGFGGLTAGPVSQVGAWPVTFEVGHFDGDAFLDVAVADYDQNQVEVSLGDGSGSFLQHAAIPSGSNPWPLHAADVDRNGTLDIVTASQVDGTVTVAHGDGQGGLVISQTIPMPNAPRCFAAGDVDNDQWIDVVVGASSSGYVLRGGPAGLGTPQPTSAFSFRYQIALGDLDSDGDLDAISRTVGGLYVSEGHGDGTFTTQGFVNSIHDFDFVAIADMDCDGFADALALQGAQHGGALQIGFGDGTTTVPNLYGFSTGNGTSEFALGDMNEDGSLDLVALNVFGLDLAVHMPTIEICAPSPYCAPKKHSAGCLPLTRSTGTPSASGATPFHVTGENIVNNRNGILFYGYAKNALPFQDGTLCVQPPLRRTPTQKSDGNPPPNDCSGSFSFDFGALILSGSDPALTPGTAVYAQHWFRDPLSLSTTGLTDGLRFEIAP